MPSNSVTAYIGVGSNLGDSTSTVRAALQALAEAEGIEEVTCAPWYRSKAIGPGDQPDYLNTALKVLTSLEPESLLDLLQSLENHHGRERHIRWGARTLDLDILLYGEYAIDTERLSVPHPRLQERNFVTAPLCDLAPKLRLPCGKVVSDINRQLGTVGLEPDHSTDE